MTTPSTLGSLLRRRRAALDLTQEAAAERVGCAVDTFRAFENGLRHPSLTMAERLADALHIPAAERAAFLQLARAQPALPQARPTAEAPSPLPAAPKRELTLGLAPLPVPATALMGREAELAQVRAQLGEPLCRLLTLVGPGGVGKTRLALQAARDLHASGAFPDGVAWVSLAPVMGFDDACSALATALGLTLYAGADPAEHLGQALAATQVLLILDNLEHVLALASLIDRLLQQAPGLRVLTTSRERLRLQAEWVFELQGLSVATDQATPIAPATLLFVERARQIVPDFRLTPQHRPVVDAICRELAGVPLAIELAAAWTHVLSPAEIAAEVRRSLDFLAADGPLLPPHQRSLRTVFARSWALLNPWEQVVCARLALFRGGCTREAAAAIVAGLPGAPPGGVLRALASLVQKSLVRRVTDARGTSRYELHELVRQYALEELEHDPEALAGARRLHAAYFLGLMQQWATALLENVSTGAREGLVPEVDNLRLAWNWAVDQCDIEALERASSALFMLWNGRDWFWDALAILDHNTDLLRARLAQFPQQPQLVEILALVLQLKGYFHSRVPQLVASQDALRESIALRGDPQTLTANGALRALAIAEAYLGNFAAGRELAERDLALMRASGTVFLVGQSLVYLAIVAWLQGDYATVRAACHEAFTATPVPQEPRAYAIGLNFLGAAALVEGRLDEAVQLGQQNFAVSATADDRVGKAMALMLLSRAALARGERDEARYLHQEAVELGRQNNDRWVLGIWQAQYGQLAAITGDDRAAAAALREAALLTIADQSLPGALAAATGLAALLARQGDTSTALSLLTVVCSHESAAHETRVLAAPLRDELAADLDAESLAAVEEAARARSLEAQIAMALSSLLD